MILALVTPIRTPPGHSKRRVLGATVVLLTSRRREAIPRAAEPSSRPAMLMPPDPPHRPGCTPPHAVYESALDHIHPIRPRRRTVGPSTAAAVLPRRSSTRWSNVTSRPSSHMPPRRIPWGTASPHGSSETSGPICVAAFSLMDSHEPGAPVVATTFWWRSPAGAGEYVRRVMRAVWSRPPPISSTMSCRRFPCGNGCSPFRSASDPSCTTTPRSPALCCVSSCGPFGPRSEMRAPGAGPGAHIGAISFLHRFGAFLNAHFHFHVCVIDGVFSEDPEGSVQFHEATHLSASDWDELQHTIRHRVLRYFHRQGLLERHVTDDMLTWQASGGFSIDASVHIPGRDRAGLERLLRYCARPPFALERLEANGYGAPGGERIVYRLPHPAPDGTTALSLTPLEFLERLALLIHPPRIHRHRYHGVLAPNAKLRYQVIALGHEQGRVEESPSGQLGTQSVAGSSGGAPGRRTSSRWASLIARVSTMSCRSSARPVVLR